MSYTIERLPGEPIVLVRITGVNSLEEQRQIYADSARLTADVEGHVWRITDFSGLQVNKATFAHTLKSSKLASSDETHSTVDPNVTVFFVAPTKESRFLRDLLAQQKAIPIFHSLEDAIKAARLQIAKRQQQTR